MARHWFAGQPSDWTFNINAANVPIVTGGQTLTMWDAQVGGSQHTNLLDSAASPITVVTSGDGSPDPIGLIPRFQGPDNIIEMYADAGGGHRVLLIATDLATRVVALEASRLVVSKAANETITSSTAFQDDDHLLITVPAGVRYELSAALFYSAHSSGDFKIEFVVPTNGFIDYGVRGLPGASTGTTGTTIHDHFFPGYQPCVFGGAAADNSTTMSATVQGTVYSGDGGTFKLRWAQGTSSATGTILRASSYITLTKMA